MTLPKQNKKQYRWSKQIKEIIAMDEKIRARIANEESARFLDSNFGGLDMSGSPDLSSPVTEKFEAQDRHGLSRVDVSGTNLLKAFVENPDQATLERVAQETNDPDLIERLEEDREDRVAADFLAAHPDYYRLDENYHALRDWLTDNNLPFDSPSLDRAFRALTKSGDLRPVPGTPKPLSDSERLHVISLCKNGQVNDAIGEYLAFALPSIEETYIDPGEFLSDPATVAVRNQAVSFVWFHSRPIQDSPEWRSFQKKFFRLRPIFTLADMDQAFSAFQQEQRAITRDRIINGDAAQMHAPTDIRQGLDSLTDDELATTYHATLRHYAANAQGAGILA
jgi:hypothetical protein